MPERVALHQTRLHTPGLALDAKGVALGSKGLVVLRSIDRLVALLAAYTRERSLEDLIPSLAIYALRSKLDAREIALEVAAESSDRMDRMADAARLVGGFTFTGTSRHFVQYRDASAPFGYDARELLATDAAFALYHAQFSQTYDVERRVDLRSLLLRLMPHVDSSSTLAPGVRLVVAEPGLGPALLHYLVRSRVEGHVCVAEWPPESAFDETPVRRWIMRVPDLPHRMRPLIHSTPGITSFVPAGPGVAVEAGFRHPVELRACPIFDPAGLVMLRAHGHAPWILERLPEMGALGAFARVELRGGERERVALGATAPDSVRVPLRLEPSGGPARHVSATWIQRGQLPMLRRLAYALSPGTLAQTTVALTSRGAFLRSSPGLEAIPLGTFFVEVHPRVFVRAGYAFTPAVAPEALATALGASETHCLFVGADAETLAVEESAFVPLETALVIALPWEPVVAEEIDQALEEPIVDLRVTPVGIWPLRGVDPPCKED